MNPTLAWHWAKNSLRTQHSDEPIVVGETLEASGPLELCKNGMHASICPLDALKYAPGSMLCRVRLDGEIIKGEDKLCARKRTVLWIADAEKMLHEFAFLCAERALDKAMVKDERSWNAIKVKRLWLAGKATDAELDAAWAAARDAAWDAAAAAEAAAWAAARDAARDAAEAAARAAAWAAGAAAWASERSWQRDTLNQMIRSLPEYKADEPLR